ncbi:hypothetical protein ACWT_4490 [Actinoplanes sp. SE50]|uniref:hypothetical protein n=1 Tax=unclassified Actinoplanes TaxID=2626549 RepID=UPI00023ECEDB|nr:MULTISPECIES: hypothetical protein [unclassified Actinoplanes]AEV85512.1 hypothetical protein ACPL_4621 [Actinoplanes sp. SE50/110]ATO83905.1 hypothetical protein ACWT_4490 [Actinoplanes sp. SE50]SLM01315.1 uncharacterized protein ACSP50_4551 [Actinoplanes sp. SE50/110]
MVGFEMDAGALSEDERAFVATTRSALSADVSGFVGRVGGRLLVGVSVVDRIPGRHPVTVLMIGVHYGDGQVLGGRLDHEDYALLGEARFEAGGPAGELGRAAGEWLADVLGRPVALYCWMRDGQAVACQYRFADTGEVLLRSGTPRPGAPDIVVPIRGDVSGIPLPVGAVLSGERPAVTGVWREG